MTFVQPKLPALETLGPMLFGLLIPQNAGEILLIARMERFMYFPELLVGHVGVDLGC